MKRIILKVASVGKTGIFISGIVNWYNTFIEQYGGIYQIQTVFFLLSCILLLNVYLIDPSA